MYHDTFYHDDKKATRSLKFAFYISDARGVNCTWFIFNKIKTLSAIYRFILFYRYYFICFPLRFYTFVLHISILSQRGLIKLVMRAMNLDNSIMSVQRDISRFNFMIDMLHTCLATIIDRSWLEDKRITTLRLFYFFIARLQLSIKEASYLEDLVLNEILIVIDDSISTLSKKLINFI